MSAAPETGGTGLSQSEWDQVHAQVQSILDSLARRVRSRCPAATEKSGRTSARAWFLFSYRDFNQERADQEAEDVVVGLLFSPSPNVNGVRITGDIGGGVSGETDYAIGERIVAANLNAVLAAACEGAEELSRQDEIVVKAVSQRRPAPSYRPGKE